MENRPTLAPIRTCSGLWPVMLLLLVVIALINPIREAPARGDDWAYSLTVRHLFETGEYRLDNWAAANMPVQICWGALLSRVFGYSFTVLRLSTLSLLFVGMIAFYFLLRDFGSDDLQASLLMLAVFSSPLILFLGVTFQTDVQFLGW